MTNTLLQELNERMLIVHEDYEKLFWISSMGDHSVDDDMEIAQSAVEAFRSDREFTNIGC